MKVPLVLAALAGASCSHNRITGTVVDRNGSPVPGAVVGLTPGHVEVVTDSEGRWTVDYLRTEAGDRVRLSPRTGYDIEVFRVGYHVSGGRLDYRRGDAEAAPITLVEDSIRVATPEDDIDPGRADARPEASGAAYEGE